MQTIDQANLDTITGGVNWKRVGQATVEWGGRALNYVGAAAVLQDWYERWRGGGQPQPTQPPAQQPAPTK